MRYLFPLPVPPRWRRRMIALGSGDPTRLICSALIADAFSVVRYPILPKIRLTGSHHAREQLLEIRHSSLYCPRDFDISPYFNVVKPTIARGFDYKALQWAGLPKARTFRSPRNQRSAREDTSIRGSLSHPARSERPPLRTVPERGTDGLTGTLRLPRVIASSALAQAVSCSATRSKAIAQMFSPQLRAVLWKSIGLALALIVLVAIALDRLIVWLVGSGSTSVEVTLGPNAHWPVIAIAWLISIAAGLGIVVGGVMLMPAVTSLVASFFADQIAEEVEREYYPADPPGTALPLGRALLEGCKTALLAIVIYVCAAPLLLFAGLGAVIFFLATAWLLGRGYFELAAMRFRPPGEAKAMRRRNAATVYVGGLLIALYVSIPIVNLATPLFAMALMVHVHKRLSRRK